MVERFHGSFEYLLDAKSRLILPARLRSHFGTKKATVSLYVDSCLAVWTPEEFERHLSKAMEMEAYGTDGRNLARTMSAGSADVEFDGQWRLTIPLSMRNWAALEPERPVTIIGALNRVELWQPDRWQRQMASSLQSLADGSSPLFSEKPAPFAPIPTPSPVGGQP